MLKFQNWYAGIWLVILVLYSFGWSTLNMRLDYSLLLFFISTIAVSAVLGFFSSPIPLIKVRWIRKRKPVITAALMLGFVLDWAYQRQIPILHPYAGFDATAEKQAIIGIPVLHVIIIAVAIFYAMYLEYLFLSEPERRCYLFEYGLLLFFLILNNSRGYAVYTLFIGILLYVAFNKKRFFETRIGVYCAAIFGGLGIVLFISIVGNIRMGYSWNDCSYIEAIGYYHDYPNWLSKHFMWFYTYSTSPLANLNFNCILFDGNINLIGLVRSIIPEQIAGYLHLSGVKATYIVQHLNACTGFVGFVTSAGVWGLYFAFVSMYSIYSVIRYFVHKYVVLETFGNAVICFLVVVFIFFDSLSVTALCYIPLFLVFGSIFLHKRFTTSEIEIVYVESV